MEPTLNIINVKGERYTVVSEPCEVCKIKVKNEVYTVPREVAALIVDLADQIQENQERRTMDAKEVSRILREQCYHIANALAGGYEGCFGENLLARKLDDTCPLPPGYEMDDGSKEEQFLSVVARRIHDASISMDKGDSKRLREYARA